MKAQDPKLKKWLDEHPDREFRFDISDDHPSPASSSTDPAPAGRPAEGLAPKAVPDGPLVLEDPYGHDSGEAVDNLILNDVDPVAANRYVVAAVKSKEDPLTFYELYGRGGLTHTAKKFPDLNVQGLRVMDLAARKPDGTHWDFSRRRDRNQAW